MKYLSVLLAGLIMVSGFAVFAESAPAKVDIHELQRELKKIQETGSGLRMVLFFERQKDFADAGSVFANMYQDSLTDLEVESKNIVEKFFGGKDTEQTLDEAIRYIGSLKKEDQASFNLFTGYLLEKKGKTAPAELKQLEKKIAGYEIESASFDLKEKGLLDKFKEWYLKRYDNIIEKLVINKDHKKFIKERKQILTCISIWDKLRDKKKVSKVSPEVEEAFNKAWNAASGNYGIGNYSEAIKGYNEAKGIWLERAIERGVNHYIGLCYEKMNDYDNAFQAYKQSIYKEKDFFIESFNHSKSICFLLPQDEANLSKKVTFFDGLLRQPPPPEIFEWTYYGKPEYFINQCLQHIGRMYDILEAENIDKEKCWLVKVEYYREVRERFTLLDYRIDIQQTIYWTYGKILEFYPEGQHKKEYYLEMVKEEKYSASHGLYYSPESPYSAMSSIFYTLAKESILSRKEKVFYFNESVRTAGEAADRISAETPSDIKNYLFYSDISSAYSNAFDYAESIDGKYEAGLNYLSVIERQEKRISSGETKTELVIQQIGIISDLIASLSLCCVDKTESLYLKLCSVASYAVGYAKPEQYAWSEMNGYFYAGANLSQGKAIINIEYLERAARKAQQIIDGNFSEWEKRSAKKTLLEILFYSEKYDSLIKECTSMLGNNAFGVEDGFLYQWIGKCYFEKALSSSFDETTQFLNEAEINYNKASAGSGHSELDIDQYLLLSQQGNCKEAFKKFKEFINQTGSEDKIPTRLYQYIMLAKDMLKIKFTPDVVDFSDTKPQTFVASLTYADGTTIETTSAISNWKWSVEGTGSISDSGNSATYAAGVDSGADIVSASCDVDLKQVLKIRGDFDSIVKIEGEVGGIIKKVIIVSQILKLDGTPKDEIPSDEPKLLEYNETAKMYAVFQAKVDNRLQWFLGFKENPPTAKTGTFLPTSIKIDNVPTLVSTWNRENGELKFEWNKIISGKKHTNTRFYKKTTDPWFSNTMSEVVLTPTGGTKEVSITRWERCTYKQENTDGVDFSVGDDIADFGTRRYSVKVVCEKNGVSKGTSQSPGKFKNVKFRIGKNGIKEGTEFDIDDKDCEINNGKWHMLKSTIHRISKKGNTVFNNSPVEFINTVLSMYDLPYIYGSDNSAASKIHQTDAYIGFDCADLIIGAFRVMNNNFSDINKYYTNANTLGIAPITTDYTHVYFPISSDYIGSGISNKKIDSQLLHMENVNTGTIKGWVFKNESQDIENNTVKIKFGEGPNQVRPGDIVAIDWRKGTNIWFEHVAIIYKDQNNNGFLDGDDLLIHGEKHKYSYSGGHLGYYSGVRGLEKAIVPQKFTIESNIVDHDKFSFSSWLKGKKTRFVIKRLK